MLFDIKEALGIEDFEKFKIKSLPSNVYWFNKNSLYYKNGVTKQDELCGNTVTLMKILSGEYKIIKKPKYDDEYWYIKSDGEARCYHWSGCAFDFMAYKMGNYFYTKEEANKNKEKIIEKCFTI